MPMIFLLIAFLSTDDKHNIIYTNIDHENNINNTTKSVLDVYNLQIN